MDEQNGVNVDADLGELASHPSRGSGRVDKAVLVDLVVTRGWKRSAAAEFFDVSGASITKAFQRMEVAVAQNIPAQQAGQELLTAQLSDSGARLGALAKQCQDILDLCSTVVSASDEYSPAVVEAKGKLRRLVGSKGSVGQMAVALMGEARKQLEFVFNIQRETFNMKRVADFQQVVLDEIKAASPEVQQRIMVRLVQVEAFRSSLDISGGGSDFAPK